MSIFDVIRYGYNVPPAREDINAIPDEHVVGLYLAIFNIEMEFFIDNFESKEIYIRNTVYNTFRISYKNSCSSLPSKMERYRKFLYTLP